MPVADLVPPQMVVNSRMLYFGWIPADPGAIAARLDPRLRAAENQAAFMNQYVVDSEDQTSGFGQYSLTYIGPDLDRFAPDGATPSRWWTDYFNSSPGMIDYVSARGVPATPGRTTIEIDGDRLVATTESDGTPVIRTTARVGSGSAGVARGQLSYITDIGGKLIDGIYPYVAQLADPFEILSLEFLEPSHPVYALRPADPLQVVWGFYSPAASFCYPGGETVLDL
ncbi:MAG: hypothetical protein MUE51_07320 [Thermoleophilia bacterium]|jgi:hypothetical protein|nr:hypothetical protein [Thermoleophilia bacterium]